MKIYIVVCDGHVSSEAYSNFEDAVKFIESRSDKPKQEESYGWVWMSETHIYAIREVNVCGK